MQAMKAGLERSTNCRRCELIDSALSNPTDAVGGLFHIQPIHNNDDDALWNPTDAVGGLFISNLKSVSVFRLCMNHPPTWLVGFSLSRLLSRRLDMKLTTNFVGGICSRNATAIFSQLLPPGGTDLMGPRRE